MTDCFLSDEIELPTEYGNLFFRVLKGATECSSPGFLVYRRPWSEVPFLRIHSSCVFSESIHSIDCDCSPQLQGALRIVAAEGGAIVYLYQEGRGLGLFGKAMGIRVQQISKVDTKRAYESMGCQVDSRDYSVAFAALLWVGFPRKIQLGTNNPAKERSAVEAGFEVVSRRVIDVPKTPLISAHEAEKQNVLGHYGTN